jgi:hypothetical protein
LSHLSFDELPDAKDKKDRQNADHDPVKEIKKGFGADGTKPVIRALKINLYRGIGIGDGPRHPVFPLCQRRLFFLQLIQVVLNGMMPIIVIEIIVFIK